MQTNDTICAISTPVGEGGIGIVRLSGSDAITIADSLFLSPKEERLVDALSHLVQYGHVVDQGRVIDEVLVTVFRAPRSYTKENVVEVSTHGGIVVTRCILDLMLKNGARLAEPGEFTKRAFLNGRIDLIQAEAVCDMIKAKTDLSLTVAARHLEGALSLRTGTLRERLMCLLAHIEAFCDFPDEDSKLFSDTKIAETLDESMRMIREMVHTYENGAIVRDGVHTVLVGRPNVGKSSLLNALLNRDRAIVSEYPGTTRDALEELIEINAIPFRLVDTAGIIQTPEHTLEYLSAQKTQEHFDRGDLILFVIDGSRPLTDEDKYIYEMLKGKKCIIVISKKDLQQKADLAYILDGKNTSFPVMSISVVTKEGIGDLERAFVDAVWKGTKKENDVYIMRIRHKRALERALIRLEEAQEKFLRKEALELLACDVKEATIAIQELIGEIYSSDILNTIFDEFCIGK